MIYLLDTDVFTLAHRATRGLRERIASERAANEVVVSVVTRIEVLRGRIESLLKASDGAGVIRAQDSLRSSETYLADFRALPFDTAAAGHFDRLRDDKKVKKTGRADLLIACIALAHGATLVTRNTKDFAQVPGLKLENWADRG